MVWTVEGEVRQVAEPARREPSTMMEVAVRERVVSASVRVEVAGTVRVLGMVTDEERR